MSYEERRRRRNRVTDNINTLYMMTVVFLVYLTGEMGRMELWYRALAAFVFIGCCELLPRLMDRLIGGKM